MSILPSGKIEKAFFMYVDPETQFSERLYVQFNPAELTLSRSVNVKQRKSVGQDAAAQTAQAVNGELEQLSMSLYFDAYTKIKGVDGANSFGLSNMLSMAKERIMGMKSKPDFISFDMNDDDDPSENYQVSKRFNKILQLFDFDYEHHTTPVVTFVWGEKFMFTGKFISYNINHTLFSKSGTPVRTKLDLVVLGNSTATELAREMFTFQSPDRTKQRTLGATDELWMMAHQEYGSASKWKVIATENQILNPRTVAPNSVLKVPSIK